MRCLDLIPCSLRHQWVYDGASKDSLGRPLHRRCARCHEAQERTYNGYGPGGFGGWEKAR